MSVDITPENVALMLEGVTPGPWWAERQTVAHILSDGRSPGYTCEATFVMPMRWQIYGPDWRHDGVMDAKGNDYLCANARFLAWAREAVPALAAELRTILMEKKS
jgi:hypothetical protein